MKAIRKIDTTETFLWQVWLHWRIWTHLNLCISKVLAMALIKLYISLLKELPPYTEHPVHLKQPIVAINIQIYLYLSKESPVFFKLTLSCTFICDIRGRRPMKYTKSLFPRWLTTSIDLHQKSRFTCCQITSCRSN